MIIETIIVGMNLAIKELVFMTLHGSFVGASELCGKRRIELHF
jgi:hypothetical protein